MVLTQDRTSSLSGRKAPLKSDVDYEVVLVDGTEAVTAAILRVRARAGTRCFPHKQPGHVASVFHNFFIFYFRKVTSVKYGTADPTRGLRI